MPMSREARSCGPMPREAGCRPAADPAAAWHRGLGPLGCLNANGFSETKWARATRVLSRRGGAHLEPEHEVGGVAGGGQGACRSPASASCKVQATRCPPKDRFEWSDRSHFIVLIVVQCWPT